MELKLEHDAHYPNVDEDILGALERYFNNKIPAGGFLMAVLENNLTMAFGRADHRNSANLKEIIGYIYNHFPSNAWGSAEKVKAFLHGLPAQ